MQKMETHFSRFDYECAKLERAAGPVVTVLDSSRWLSSRAHAIVDHIDREGVSSCASLEPQRPRRKEMNDNTLGVA